MFDAETTAKLLGMLPLSLVEKVIVDEGKQARRRGGKLPPPVVALVVVFMGLFRHLSIDSVLGKLEEALGGLPEWRGRRPHSTHVSTGMDKLGWETLRAIFRRFSEWIRKQCELEVLWKELAVYALDGTCLRTPDTEENEAWFGRPSSGKGAGAFPQIRCVALFACFSHTLVDAAFASYKKIREGDAVGEIALALQGILPRLKAGSLVLMDRGYYAYALIRAFLEANVQFVIRMRTASSLKLKRRTKLGRNDWLIEIAVPKSLRLRQGVQPLTQLRMIKYQRRGFRPVSLLTTLLDPALYSRQEIAELYHVRWEAELGFRELKTGLLGNGSTGRKVHFRCKKPGRVLAEAYGALIAYNCVRLQMAEAASAEGKVEPRYLSFVGCLDEIRACLASTGRLSPAQLRVHKRRLMARLLTRRLPPRRQRRYPRVVKATFSPYPAKRNRREAA